MIHEQIAEQHSIVLDRFTLRPTKRSDAGLFAMYAGDKRVAEMTRSIPHPFPPGAAEAYLEAVAKPDRSTDIWVIDGTNSGHAEVSGMVMLDRLDRQQTEISFWVAPAFWNMGVASEAVQGLIDANPHRTRTLFAEVFQDNPGSARVLTNCGFEYLGDAEGFSVARNASVPTWTYSRSLTG